MDALKKIAAAAGALKLLPLPSVVLFPHTAVPLHIFEPRYRELVHHSLASDQVLALAVLQPGWERDYYGRPPTSPILCAGSITEHQELADGRYLIVVEGEVRARVARELPPRHSYREVSVELLEDVPYPGPEEAQLRQAVLELASMLPQPLADEFIHEAASHSGGALADVVAGSVVEELGARQRLLEELDVRARIHAVLSEIGGLIAQADAGRPHPVLN